MIPGITGGSGGLSDSSQTSSGANQSTGFSQVFKSGAVNFGQKKNPLNTAIMIGGAVVGLVVLLKVLK